VAVLLPVGAVTLTVLGHPVINGGMVSSPGPPPDSRNKEKWHLMTKNKNNINIMITQGNWPDVGNWSDAKTGGSVRMSGAHWHYILPTMSPLVKLLVKRLFRMLMYVMNHPVVVTGKEL
jgi:hypothetical protein